MRAKHARGSRDGGVATFDPTRLREHRSRELTIEQVLPGIPEPNPSSADTKRTVAVAQAALQFGTYRSMSHLKPNKGDDDWVPDDAQRFWNAQIGWRVVNLHGGIVVVMRASDGIELWRATFPTKPDTEWCCGAVNCALTARASDAWVDTQTRTLVVDYGYSQGPDECEQPGDFVIAQLP